MKNKILYNGKEYLLLLSMIISVLSASCSDEEQTNSLPKRVPLLLIGEAVPMKAPSATRATPNGNWRTEDRVAIQVADEGVKKYKPLVGTGDGDSFYWRSTTEKKKITGWYPFSESMPTELKLSTDQSEEGYFQSDFMWGSTEISYTKGVSTLSFTHRVAKLTVVLKAEPGLSIDGAKVLINGYTQADVNQEDGTLTKKGKREWVIATTGGYNALLIPDEEGTTERFIEVKTADGYSYYYQPENVADTQLLSGTAYTYTITITRDGLVINASDSAEWLYGGSEDVTSTVKTKE